MSTVCAYPATAAGFSSVNSSHTASVSASQVHSLSFAGEMPGFEFPGGRISQWPCDINCARGLHQTCPRNNNTSSSSATGKYNMGNNGALTTVLGSNNSQFPVPPISVETLFFKTSNNNSNNLNLYGFPTNNSHHNNSKGPPSYALNVVAAKLDQQQQQQQVNPKKRSAAHLVEKNRTGNVRWPVWPESGLASNSLPPTPALVPTPNNQSHTQLHAEHHHPQPHHQQQQQCLLCCHSRPKNGSAVNSSNPAMASHHSFSSATAVNQQDALFRRPLQERDPNCPRLGSELLLADEAMGSNGPTNPANASISNTNCKTGLKAAVAAGSGVTKESTLPSLPSSPAAASWALLTSYYPPLSNRMNASHSNSRPLALDPKKDYSVGLSVDCSVEYDLPRVVRPPPGAQPLLMLAPRPSIPLPPTPTLLRPPPLYPTSSASSTSHSTSRARQSLDYRSGSSNASQPQQQQQWTRNSAAKAKQQQLNVASQTQRLLQQGFPVGVTAPASNLVPLQEGNGRCGCPACLQQQQQRLSTTLQAARKLEANNGSGAVASTTSSASTSSSVVNPHYMPMPPAAFHPSALNGKPNWSHWSPPVGSSPGKGLSSAIPPATAATNFYHHQQQMLKQQQEWSSAALPALVKMSELSQQQTKAASAAECSQQAPNRRSSRKRSAAVLKNEPAAMACWPPNSVMTSGGSSSEAKLARLEAHLSSTWYPVNNPTLWPMKVYQ